MFGWFKKASKDRVLKTMDALTYLANIATACKINSSLMSKNSRITDDELPQVVAIRTNYLFGKKLSESHIHLNVNDEFNAAIGWLAGDSLFRELVVQSLRVMNVSKISKDGNSLILGEDVLSIFGYLYTEEPTIESYKILVFKAIDSLDPDSRNFILQKAIKLGFS